MLIRFSHPVIVNLRHDIFFLFFVCLFFLLILLSVETFLFLYLYFFLKRVVCPLFPDISCIKNFPLIIGLIALALVVIIIVIVIAVCCAKRRKSRYGMQTMSGKLSYIPFNWWIRIILLPGWFQTLTHCCTPTRTDEFCVVLSIDRQLN